MSRAKNTGEAFEREVEELLRLRGYSVSRDELISGTQIDLVAQKDDLLTNIVLLVECADRAKPVGVDLLKKKSAILASVRDPESLFRLLFVSRVGFTKEARAFARESPSLLLLTRDELEAQLVNFKPYAELYIRNFEASHGMFREARLNETYIELSARTETGRPIPLLAKEVRRWLDDSSNNLLFLLGEYGSGKTSFCRHFVYEMLHERYKAQGAHQATPILVNLRDFRKARNVQQFVLETLESNYGITLPSFLAFEKLCSAGRVLLVLDGLDEMAEGSGRTQIIDCFNQIFLLASLNTKVLLTCRSNFFRSHADVVEALKRLSISLPPKKPGIEKGGRLSFEHHGRIVYLERLDPEKVREFVERRMGDKADEIIGEIREINDLSDLSTRPVLLDMILTTLPQLLETDARVNSAALYSHYTDRWTDRDKWRLKVPLEVRQDFCGALAWEMHKRRMREIPNDTLKTVMRSSLKALARSVAELENFEGDLQVCSFLVRSGHQDTFRFAHKSFREYFVARRLVDSLQAGEHTEESSAENQPADTQRRDGAPIDEPQAGSRSRHEEVSSREEVLPVAGTSYGAQDSRSTGVLEELTNKQSPVIGLDGSEYFRALFATEIRVIHFGNVFDTMSLRFNDLPLTFGRQSLRAHLERAVEEALVGVEAVGFEISEEIATFALEEISNRDLVLAELVESLSEESLTRLTEVVRRGRSALFANENRKFLREYVVGDGDKRLKLAFCVALASAPSNLDGEFLRASREALAAEEWSYFLFELDSADPVGLALVEECLKWSDLRGIDRLICAYRLRGSAIQSDVGGSLDEVIWQLVDGRDHDAMPLVISVLPALRHSSAVKGLRQMIESDLDDQWKTEAVQGLASLGGPGVAQLLRSLSATTGDKELRRALKAAERTVRDRESFEHQSAGWTSEEVADSFREQLWGAVRRA